jgi:hypothetical protein
MGLSVRLSVCHASAAALGKHMSKGNKGTQPERKLEAQENQAALHISFYIK